MTGARLRLLGAFALVSGLALGFADFAAPLFGEQHPATQLSRAALAPTCHQRAERSFTVDGVGLASCARCTGLHAAGIAGGAWLLVVPAAAGFRLPRPRRLALLGVVPLLLDVAAGLCWSSWDHPWLRAATGLFAGCTLLLAPSATTR